MTISVSVISVRSPALAGDHDPAGHRVPLLPIERHRRDRLRRPSGSGREHEDQDPVLPVHVHLEPLLEFGHRKTHSRGEKLHGRAGAEIRPQIPSLGLLPVGAIGHQRAPVDHHDGPIRFVHLPPNPVGFLEEQGALAHRLGGQERVPPPLHNRGPKTRNLSLLRLEALDNLDSLLALNRSRGRRRRRSPRGPPGQPQRRDRSEAEPHPGHSKPRVSAPIPLPLPLAFERSAPNCTSRTDRSSHRERNNGPRTAKRARDRNCRRP